MPWHEVFERPTSYARTRQCVPADPPKPLILAGWAYSNDIEKMRRWEETVAWATKNGCPDLVGISDTDFYYVDEPTSYNVGPLGGPRYRPWDFEGEKRPPADQLSHRVLRGGSWSNGPISLRTAYRSSSTPDARSNGIGCRGARGLPLSR